MGIFQSCLRPFRQWLRKRVKRLIFFAFLFISTIQVYNWAMTEYGNAAALNYFIDEEGYRKLEYVVDTPNCKILKVSPWENAILPFIKPKITPPNCSLQNNGKHWTYLVNSTLHMNQSAIRASGYSLSSLRCCYKGILRVEQTLQEHDWSADTQVKYTSNCITMGETTRLEHEFVRVFCKCTSWPYFGEVVYREFYSVAIPQKKLSKRKLKYWESKQDNPAIDLNTGSLGRQLPPSVVMLGIDSLSRMNFHRSFNLSRAFLEEIGAIELLGYTKVGENTHPNTLAFLSGYDPSDLTKGCMRTPDTPQDFCPYIWKRFNEANYLTGTVEDAPGLVGFNYLKLGFVEQPTDFYFRPFMLAVHKSLPRKDYYHTDCIGRFTTEETLLNYIRGIMSYSSKAPVFIHSWMTSLAHLDINGARFADRTIFDFLTGVDLSNTILIFLSDHGQRYGAIRETLAGWYEDKLPILTIYLPPKVKSRFPSWEHNLRQNALRLTSPFDLYKMMEHVLETFSEVKTDQNPNRIQEEENSGPIFDKFSQEPNPSRSYGQSLFTQISPSRRCSDAGIRINYCACLPPKKLNFSDPGVTGAAEAAVKYLNGELPRQCAQAKLDRITAGAVMHSGNEIGEDVVTYVVTFYTNPGQFMFEAIVEYTGRNKVDLGVKTEERGFRITTDLLRMNKIVRDASCVDTSLLERYCYCQ